MAPNAVQRLHRIQQRRHSIQEKIDLKAKELKKLRESPVSQAANDNTEQPPRRALIKRLKRQLQKLKAAQKRLAEKIRNLVDDLHFKTAHLLCKRFKVILWPSLAVSRLVRRRPEAPREGDAARAGHGQKSTTASSTAAPSAGSAPSDPATADSVVSSPRPKGQQRKLRKRETRALLDLRHYVFRLRLKAKAEAVSFLHPEQAPCRVVEVGEAYTSKTCGRCGTLNHQLGGKKVFCCPAPGCGNISDRDRHAARNILLRYLVTDNEFFTPLRPAAAAAAAAAGQAPAPAPARVLSSASVVHPFLRRETGQ